MLQPLDHLPESAGSSSSTDRDNDFPVKKSQTEWKQRLAPEAFHVLFEAGTERAGTSPLNHEVRQGIFVCAACHHPIFESSTKYDSGSGWPSFWKAYPSAIGISTDHKLGYPRIEYHCAGCGGHLGHRFDDGPQPTGTRYCNNGVALIFVSKGDTLPSLRS